MSKIGHYLQEHVVGEVMTSPDARRYFATDASIFSVVPVLVLYPRNENDIRKTARFTWQLAERGRIISMTARGLGTDQTGAALGNGIILVFPAHMNKILELDSKTGMVSVEPGINFGKLQQSLQTHGRFVPSYPTTIEYSTIGGAVGNNASGKNSMKYGSMRSYVQGLRVVLANGEVIETGRLNKRELNKKLGLSTFEGEVYRLVDTLLEENYKVVDKIERNVTMNNAGYDLLDIRQNDGSFDLTPLFVGSQGTLGIITEILLNTEVNNPESSLVIASFDTLEKAQQAIMSLRNMTEIPSALEMVDINFINQINTINPNLLKDFMDQPFPAILLFIEYDTANDRLKKKTLKKATKILDKLSTNIIVEEDIDKQQQFWKIRQASGTILTYNNGKQRAIPIIEDAAVSPDQLGTLIKGLYAICNKLAIEPALWGHAGDGNIHVQPQLDLAAIGDRQKAFRLMEEYYSLVLSLGGTISAEHNDGRLRAPYIERQYGSEAYGLFVKIKQIFDPYGTLNPGVKVGISLDDLKNIIRADYDLEHLYDHLPNS